ncbi:MAG TPA: TonB-dependent receptor plug domain-containing protein [Mucilaginibacter sp.]|nr:TonB-dependent receptor plug domain-containing protein [Mucilaginibacter sp.]
MRKPFILTIALCLSGLAAFCQGDSLLLNKLKAFNQTRPVEKAYLHFDKPYYAAGDTIYFKAYTTMGERHVPSRIGGILHVDLINTKNKVDQSIKLQSADGVSWGDFALPDSLPKGNYRVRAWTEWMRNDPGSFFEKVIPVGTLQNGKMVEGKAANGKPDVQFFPEGGALVANIKSRIAFKAIGPTGLGTAVKGVVTDNELKEIVSFTSAHLGMGSFELTPEPGKTYQAKLTFANGTTQALPLPAADGQGIALSVNNDSIPVAKARITATSDYLAANKGKIFTLLINSGGVATTASCTLDSTATVLYVLKRKLFTGIASIILFSPNNEPLCERLIFVQNYDQLSLNVNTDKAQYATREKVTLKLNAKTRSDSAATGHFYIAVTDESKVPEDENNETTILTDLLLTSDLKGYIEQPNYYFNHINDTTGKNLDLVMLTHGYRRFEWKEILNNSQPVAYRPESDLSISGTVKTVLGKPVAKGTVSLITQMGGPVLSQVTDEKGNFRFSNLLFGDTAKFILQAATSKGRISTVITYNKQQDEPRVTPQLQSSEDTSRHMLTYLQNHKEQWDQYAKYGLPNGKLLKEVKIKAVIHKDENYPSSSLLGPGHADQVLHADEIEKFGGQLASNLDGRLVGIRFQNPQSGNGGRAFLVGYTTGPMLVILDGVNMGGMALNLINPSTIETIEVMRFGSASIYGMNAGNGVIIITTKRGKGLQAKDIASTGVLPITVMGFYKARQFYAPKYEHPNDNLNHKDLRSTIYWQPELTTDKDGNASLSFYNADGTGNYRVIIEGMDGKGNIGRTVYTYKVN